MVGINDIYAVTRGNFHNYVIHFSKHLPHKIPLSVNHAVHIRSLCCFYLHWSPGFHSWFHGSSQLALLWCKLIPSSLRRWVCHSTFINWQFIVKEQTDYYGIDLLEELYAVTLRASLNVYLALRTVLPSGSDHLQHALGTHELCLQISLQLLPSGGLPQQWVIPALSSIFKKLNTFVIPVNTELPHLRRIFGF